MRGSAAFRTAIAPGGVLAGPWVRNELWRRAKAVPSLDLRFADNKSLVDATTGALLVTFTRASSATYVDSAGTIRSAVTNLLLRSEEFDNASWTKQASVSVSANTTTAPDGALTADTITADSALGIYQSITSTVGLTYANSIYVKAGTATSMLLRDDNGAGRHIQFNPSTGVITATSGTLLSSASTAVGDGWFRYSMVYVADATTARGVLRPSSSGSAQTFILWGAQLEQSSTVGEYIPTTSTVNSAPRFDHNPTTGESLGLLVEEARTNLLLRSEEFDSASWSKFQATSTANTISAPSLAVTAETITEQAISGTHVVFQDYTTSSAVTHTLSVFAKANQRSRLMLLMSDGGSNSVNASFNLTAGNVIAQNNVGTGSAAVGSIVALANGWFRCVLAGIPASSLTTLRSHFYILDNSSSTSYTGDGTSGLYIWGAQLEAGAFPTSYIPTTTAAATRSADVASITGTAFSSWYRQDEGSFFCSVNPVKGIVLFGTADSFDNTQYVTNALSSNISIRSGGSDQATLTAPVSTAVVTNLAFGYQANNFAACSNGGIITTDASGSVPASQVRLKIGSSAWDTTGGNNMNGTIRRLVFWPQRLPDSSLQAITQ